MGISAYLSKGLPIHIQKKTYKSKTWEWICVNRILDLAAGSLSFKHFVVLYRGTMKNKNKMCTILICDDSGYNIEI